MANPRYFYTTLLICLLIFAACLAMAGPMRAGLPVAGDLTQRLTYITAYLPMWQGGWLLWMGSALGLMLFAQMFATAISDGLLRRYGLTLVCLGIIPDLSAETLYAFVLPTLSKQGVTIDSLLLIDQVAMHLTGVLGNGLYNLGGLLLTVALWQARAELRLWLLPGLVAWVLGIGLSVALALQQLGLAEALTAASMALSTAWFALIGWKLWGAPRV